MAGSKIRILIVDDEPDYCDVMSMILSDEGYEVQSCNDGIEALKKLGESEFDLVLTDLMMPKMDGSKLLAEIKSKYEGVEVIMMTAYSTVERAVEAMKHGAYTYVTKGGSPELLLAEVRLLSDLKELRHENKRLRSRLNTTDFLLDSKNEKFLDVLRVAEKAAASTANILILGESGVGKEVLARYIHKSSNRSERNFVDLNCHAIPETVLESELFGHEKGAFTGAAYKRIGRFEDAHKGTLFLDEIGDISLITQAKLLKVIENKKLYPIGGNGFVDVDFRLLAATNKTLSDEIQKGLFREDLFYRLSTITIEIPPLRERREDIPAFVEYFLKKCQEDMKKKINRIEEEARIFLINYDYPGNVRELKNLIERLVVLSEDGIIRAEHLPGRVGYKKSLETPMEEGCLKLEDIESSEEPLEQLKETLRSVRKKAEVEYIQKIINQEKGNLNKVAEILGITRRQLNNKILEFDIPR